MASPQTADVYGFFSSARAVHLICFLRQRSFAATITAPRTFTCYLDRAPHGLPPRMFQFVAAGVSTARGCLVSEFLYQRKNTAQRPPPSMGRRVQLNVPFTVLVGRGTPSPLLPLFTQSLKTSRLEGPPPTLHFLIELHSPAHTPAGYITLYILVHTPTPSRDCIATVSYRSTKSWALSRRGVEPTGNEASSPTPTPHVTFCTTLSVEQTVRGNKK